MKICKRCFREFDEMEDSDSSPAENLGNIFLRDIGIDDISNLCPDCREQLGVILCCGLVSGSSWKE